MFHPGDECEPVKPGEYQDPKESYYIDMAEVENWSHWRDYNPKKIHVRKPKPDFNPAQFDADLAESDE